MRNRDLQAAHFAVGNAQTDALPDENLVTGLESGRTALSGFPERH
jgi:hypothetical protein